MTQERIQKTKAKTNAHKMRRQLKPKPNLPMLKNSKSDIDGILDEIDTILDSEAQAMVSSYVQKGGQ